MTSKTSLPKDVLWESHTKKLLVQLIFELGGNTHIIWDRKNLYVIRWTQKYFKKIDFIKFFLFHEINVVKNSFFGLDLKFLGEKFLFVAFSAKSI